MFLNTNISVVFMFEPDMRSKYAWKPFNIATNVEHLFIYLTSYVGKFCGKIFFRNPANVSVFNLLR